MIAAVTTFNGRGYTKYGRRFLQTFERHWPREVKLYVYAEGCRPVSKRAEIRDLLSCCPGLRQFKQDHGHLRSRDFRFDAVRFAHKVFAVAHAARTVDADKLFWVDADIVTFDDIPLAFLESCLPPGYYTSCLLRAGVHSECGFMGFDLRHPAHLDFMKAWERWYTSGRLFNLPEWHDCIVYDTVRQRLEKVGRIRTHNLSGSYTWVWHPFINSRLGRFMDHLKGKRKIRGRSGAGDLVVARSEPYWRRVAKASSGRRRQRRVGQRALDR